MSSKTINTYRRLHNMDHGVYYGNLSRYGYIQEVILFVPIDSYELIYNYLDISYPENLSPYRRLRPSTAYVFKETKIIPDNIKKMLYSKDEVTVRMGIEIMKNYEY